jgi:hypothetical protein
MGRRNPISYVAYSFVVPQEFHHCHIRQDLPPW